VGRRLLSELTAPLLVFSRCRALVAQRQVIFSRSPFAAVSLDREIDVGILIEKEHVGLQSRILIGSQIGLVVIKVNVLDVLDEQLFVGRSGRWWWRRRWRLSHRQVNSGILCSARSLRYQVVAVESDGDTAWEPLV
jgi:hypothetical protein